MRSLWRFVRIPRNRVILSWFGGMLAVSASGAWAVVTYVWPSHQDSGASYVCTQGGIAAGRNATGNSIVYNGNGPAFSTTGTFKCGDDTKK